MGLFDVAPTTIHRDPHTMLNLLSCMGTHLTPKVGTRTTSGSYY
jgi:hypothetical protein